MTRSRRMNGASAPNKNEQSRIEAMLKHSRKRMLQRQNKPLAMQAEQERLVIEAKLAIAAPKAEALDRIAAADGSLCLTDAAKELQVRPKDLIGYLSSHNWIYRRVGGASWIAYQDRIQAGVLEHKSVVLIDSEGRERIRDQVRVTANGLARLSELLNGGRQAA